MPVLIRENCPNCGSSSIVFHGNIKKQCEKCMTLYSDPFVERCTIGHLYVINGNINRCPECLILARLPENQEVFAKIINNMRKKGATYQDIAKDFGVTEKRIDNVIQLTKQN